MLFIIVYKGFIFVLKITKNDAIEISAVSFGYSWKKLSVFLENLFNYRLK